MIFRLILVLSILVFITGCNKFKTEWEYIQESSNYLQANEQQKAEAILKEGILKYSGSSPLKLALFNFYLDTKQFDSAENYFRIGQFSFDDSANIYSRLANHFFEVKSWNKAYDYYSEQGSAYTVIGLEKKECIKYEVAVEAYRNAAAAALNMGDVNRIQNTYREILKVASMESCMGTTSKKSIEEVRNWLPKNLRK